MKSKVSICFGSGLMALDILLKDNEEHNISYYAGGSCGNVLMILSHLGWYTYPIARLKNDKFATRLIQDLVKYNVCTNFVSQTEDGSTPVIIQRNTVDKQGLPKHKFELVNPLTQEFLPRFKSITQQMAQEVIHNFESVPDVFYFDRATPGILMLAKYYKSKGSIIMFEPSSMGSRDFDKALKLIDILKYSDQRLHDYKSQYIQSCVPIEIETSGAKGLSYRCNFIDNNWHHMEAFKVEQIVDSSGAGDWTSAGIIYYLRDKYNSCINELYQSDIEQMLKFGQKLGAMNCSYEGARGLMKLVKDEILKNI